SSSAPGVVAVHEDGMLEAKAAGSARITAKSGTASESVEIKALPNTVANLDVTPASAEGRTGDVIKFTVVARGRSGKPVAPVAPQWSFSPGHGMIDPNGGFVGYEPGTYLVTANIGGRVAEASVTLKSRDVRRPATVVGRLPRTRFTTEEVWIHP